MAEIGCNAPRRSNAEVYSDCYRVISDLGCWWIYCEINIFAVLLCCGISVDLLIFYSFWSPAFSMLRRKKVEMVMIHNIWIQKDRWDLFSALTFMRKNLETSCKFFF